MRTASWIESELRGEKETVTRAVAKAVKDLTRDLSEVTRLRLKCPVGAYVESLPPSVGIGGSLPETRCNGKAPVNIDDTLDRMAQNIEKCLEESNEDVLGDYVGCAPTMQTKALTLLALGVTNSPQNNTVMSVPKATDVAECPQPPPKIHIYWLLLALLARRKKWDLKELTQVVLAHELAHAYTHHGVDADDRDGRDPWFKALAPKDSEGLAEFWSLQALWKKFGGRSSLVNVYSGLLKSSSSVYHTHIPWISGEQRQVLVQRCADPVEFDHFSALETVRYAVLLSRESSNEGGVDYWIRALCARQTGNTTITYF